MIWQDLVFTIGGVFFALSLYPSLTTDDKPHALTSLVTSFVLLGFAKAQFSLDLNFAAVVSLITAVLWYTLFTQKFLGEK